MPVYADLELGKVTPNKLKSYHHYFQPYLDEPNPVFDDAEFDAKIRGEAREIYDWMSHAKAWPDNDKQTAALHAEAARLFLYFSHIQIEGAGELAMKHFKAMNGAEVGDAAMWADFIRLADEVGDTETADQLTEKLLNSDPEAAAGSNLHYRMGMSLYERGYFREAFEHLQKQHAHDPTYRNTSNMLTAMEIWVEEWGFVPERVGFETSADGKVKIPNPRQAQGL